MKLLKNYSLAIPLLVLAVMVLSMGWMLRAPGYFMDDWANVYSQLIGGPESTRLLHAYDGRPLAGDYRVFLYEILGLNPTVWLVFSLGLRYLSVIFMWLVFRRIWPRAEVLLGLAAVLYAVYPIFAQQPLAITFIGHWTALLAQSVSFYLMLLAVDRPRQYWIFTLPAVALSALGLTITEYFIGLELVRPLLLWWVFSRQSLSRSARWKKTLLHFSPYLLAAGLFVLWRVFFIELPTGDRNEITLFRQLQQAPLQTAVGLLLMPLQDTIAILLGAWYKTYQPEILKLDGPMDALAVGVTAAAAGLILALFVKRSDPQPADQDAQADTGKEQFITGLAMVLLGALPGWMIGRQVGDTTGIWNDRFAMASMAGAALTLVVLLQRLLRSRKFWLGSTALLIGLASGWQVRTANDFRWSWIFQERFYNQLLWRIPSLEPDTLFLADREFFPKMGVYPTAFAINTLYPQSGRTNQVDYWFLTITKYFGDDWAAFLDETPIFVKKWQTFFAGNSRQSVVVDYSSAVPHCLWVLGPEDARNPDISKTTRDTLPLSDLSRIHRESTPILLDIGLSAPEPDNTWCYFFQKADLAQQFGDWEIIPALWEQSLPYQSGVHDGVELVPFIEGFLRTGDFVMARDLTLRANKNSQRYDGYLCSIWERTLPGMALDQNQAEIAQEIEAGLGCDLH